MASLGNTTSITAIVTNSVGTVYIAGQFTVTSNELTSDSAYNIAKWDGTTWTLLNTGQTLPAIKTMILYADTLIVTAIDTTLSISLTTQAAISLTNISATVMVNNDNTLYYITGTGDAASIKSATIGSSSTIGTSSPITFAHGPPTGLNFNQNILYVTDGTCVYKSDGTKLTLSTTFSTGSIVEFTFYKSQLFIITVANLYIYELNATDEYDIVVTVGITNANHISVNRAIIITGTHGEIYSYSNMFLEAVLNEYNAIVAQNIQIQTQLSNLVNIYSIDDKKVHYQSQQTDYLAKIYYYLFILYYICAIISIYFIVKSDKNKYIKAGIIIYIFIYPYIVNPILYRIYEMITYLYALINVHVYTP